MSLEKHPRPIPPPGRIVHEGGILGSVLLIVMLAVCMTAVITSVL